MELAGLCAICNKLSRHLNTCWNCGNRVCDAHFDLNSGRCVACSLGRTFPSDKGRKTLKTDARRKMIR